MGSSIVKVVLLVVNTLGGLAILAFLLRFLFQACRADYYNPVSQAINKFTAPILTPLRKIIPSWNQFDFASLIVALIISVIATSVMAMVQEGSIFLPNIGIVISWTFLGLVTFILNIYYYGLFIVIIMSWVAPYSGNPVILLLQQLLEPIQSRLRKIIPPMGGLDISPIFIILGILIIRDVFIYEIAAGLGLGNLGARIVIGF